MPPSEPAPETAAAEAQPPDRPAKRSRFGIWLVIGAVVVLGALIVTNRQPSEPTIAEGTLLDGDLTLITSDREDVACSTGDKVGDMHCGFNKDGAPWAIDEKDRLQPFMTVDRHLYVIPGLFLEPAIAARYKTEPPHGTREQLKRFTAHCKMKVIGKMSGFKLRWVANSGWSPPQKAEVVSVSGCKVDG